VQRQPLGIVPRGEGLDLHLADVDRLPLQRLAEGQGIADGLGLRVGQQIEAMQQLGGTGDFPQVGPGRIDLHQPAVSAEHGDGKGGLLHQPLETVFAGPLRGQQLQVQRPAVVEIPPADHHPQHPPLLLQATEGDAQGDAAAFDHDRAVGGDLAADQKSLQFLPQPGQHLPRRLTRPGRLRRGILRQPSACRRIAMTQMQLAVEHHRRFGQVLQRDTIEHFFPRHDRLTAL